MDTITRMRAFVAVADAGGYSAAARAHGRSKALMSKYVSELEDELGARLLNRTTRHLSLTEAGEAAYDEAQEVLKRVSQLRETIEAANSSPRGRLRVAIPRTLGEGELGAGIMEFLCTFPDIRLEIDLDERFVDLVSEGYDVAIRIAVLEDSSMIARKLSPYRVVICASPEFIATHGRPEHPSDLAGMPCVIDTNSKSRTNWPFLDGDQKTTVNVNGRVVANSPVTAALAAQAGLGFTRSPWSAVQDMVREGKLATVLDAYETDDLGIYAVYAHRDRLPVKIRKFIDFLADWYDNERRSTQ